MATVIDRVDRLEEALANFITSVGIEFNKVYNSQLRTEAELRAFKEEMREFKEENRRQTRAMNRQWGDLANKLGTLVEDLVYPSLPRIVAQTLGQEILDLGVRRKRRVPILSHRQCFSAGRNRPRSIACWRINPASNPIDKRLWIGSIGQCPIPDAIQCPQ